MVGVGTTSAANLVVDQFDTDAGESATVLFAPGLAHRLLKCCADDTIVGVKLEDGNRYGAVVANEITRVLPRGVPFSAVVASAAIAKAERAIRPESIALAVFGGIAGLATLAIAGQVIGRRLWLDAGPRGIPRPGCRPDHDLCRRTDRGVGGRAGRLVVVGRRSCRLVPPGPARAGETLSTGSRQRRLDGNRPEPVGACRCSFWGFTGCRALGNDPALLGPTPAGG